MKMPEEKIDPMLFAPCGMNCLVCYKHCYHNKPCSGCRNSDKGKPEHCRKCRIKDCIGDKGLAYCYECPEHPCRLIKKFVGAVFVCPVYPAGCFAERGCGMCGSWCFRFPPIGSFLRRKDGAWRILGAEYKRYMGEVRQHF